MIYNDFLIGYYIGIVILLLGLCLFCTYLHQKMWSIYKDEVSNTFSKYKYNTAKQIVREDRNWQNKVSLMYGNPSKIPLYRRYGIDPFFYNVDIRDNLFTYLMFNITHLIYHQRTMLFNQTFTISLKNNTLGTDFYAIKYNRRLKPYYKLIKFLYDDLNITKRNIKDFLNDNHIMVAHIFGWARTNQLTLKFKKKIFLTKINIIFDYIFWLIFENLLTLQRKKNHKQK